MRRHRSATHGPSWSRVVGAVAPVAVLAAGIAGSAAAFAVERDWHERDVAKRLAMVADDVRAQLQDLVDAQTGAAGATASAMTVNPELDRVTFDRFADQLRAHYPTLLGVGWVRRVPADELTEFVAAARRDGAPHYPLPEHAGRSSSAVILYNEPAETLQSSWGFDLFTVPTAADALARAVATGRPTLTERLVLAVDMARPPAEQPASHVIYDPVYEPGAPVATAAERRDALIGWANVPFRTDDLLDQVRIPDGIALALDDGAGPIVAGDDAREPTRTSRLAIDAVDQIWWLDVQPVGGFAADIADRLRLASILAITATAVLAGLVALLARANRRWTGAAEHAARSLTATQQRLAAIMAGAPDLILVVGADGVVEWASARARDLLGVDPTSLVGRPADAIIAGWPGRAGDDDVAIERADGTRVPVEVTVRALRPEEDGAPVVAVVRDVSMRHRSEADQALLSSIVTTTDDAIVTTASNGSITSWNRGAERLYGWSADDAIGRPLTFVLSRDRDDGHDVLETAAGGGAVYQRNVQHLRADGELVHVSVTASPLPGRSGQPGGTSFIMRDVSAEVRGRAKLAAYADELEQSNRDLEEFATVVAHDLSEPLRVVGGYVGLITHRYTLGRPIDRAGLEYLEAISGGVERLRQLIEGFLELSRLRADGRALGPVDLDGVAASALANLASAIVDESATVEVASLPTVRGDRAQLVQLIQNLVANAIRFHEPGHAPRVAVEAEPGPEPGRWTITVRDDGIGIPAEHRDRIFGMFRRLYTTDRYEGSGIGLAVCRRIAALHGGEISVESTPGAGSAFHVVLDGVDRQERPPNTRDREIVHA